MILEQIFGDESKFNNEFTSNYYLLQINILIS